jgi:rhodanese-related sulfurtransferase
MMTKSNFLTVTMKTLNRKFIVALCGGVMCISSFVAYAALDTKNIPEVKRTPQALYLSAEDAYALRSSSQNVVLIDVRSREEAMYLGMPSTADALIPFMNIDARVWDPKRNSFRLVMNDEFESGVNEFLHARGLDADATILLLCREGRRSARAARFLNQLGYSNVYTVVDGFEGDLAKAGVHKDKRMINGWKNAGLPWTYQLTADKFFFAD